MNRIMKVGVAALALAAVGSVYAQEEETEAVAENAIGWTPIAFGLATPVQIPWGLDRWDVFGLDLNIFYSDAPYMYGLQIGAIGNTTRNDLIGLGIGGLFNWAKADVYGMRVGVFNANKGSCYGMDVGAAGYHNRMVGFDVEGVGTWQQDMTGLTVSLLGSVTRNEHVGCSIGAVSIANIAYGCQVGIAYNHAEELHGCQIGVVNYARECAWGFQIGLVNIIIDNKIKVLPLVNCYF